MGLNIKNEHTTALVRELAERTGSTQTAAITEAVQAKLAELDRHDPDADRRRAQRHADVRKLLAELHGSLTENERAQLRTADRQLYDAAGLPS